MRGEGRGEEGRGEEGRFSTKSSNTKGYTRQIAKATKGKTKGDWFHNEFHKRYNNSSTPSRVLPRRKEERGSGGKSKPTAEFLDIKAFCCMWWGEGRRSCGSARRHSGRGRGWDTKGDVHGMTRASALS